LILAPLFSQSLVNWLSLPCTDSALEPDYLQFRSMSPLSIERSPQTAHRLIKLRRPLGCCRSRIVSRIRRVAPDWTTIEWFRHWAVWRARGWRRFAYDDRCSRSWCNRCRRARRAGVSRCIFARIDGIRHTRQNRECRKDTKSYRDKKQTHTISRRFLAPPKHRVTLRTGSKTHSPSPGVKSNFLTFCRNQIKITKHKNSRRSVDSRIET
jgi:hypothetical protein